MLLNKQNLEHQNMIKEKWYWASYEWFSDYINTLIWFVNVYQFRYLNKNHHMKMGTRLFVIPIIRKRNFDS